MVYKIDPWIVVAGRHRIDDHQQKSGQETSDVAQADHQNSFRHLNFTFANLPLKENAASGFGRFCGRFFASHPHLLENENVADRNDDERKKKSDGN